MQDTYKLTKEQAEQALKLKRDIDNIQMAILQIREKGVSVREASKDFILNNLEAQLQKVRNQQQEVKVEEASTSSNSVVSRGEQRRQER